MTFQFTDLVPTRVALVYGAEPTFSIATVNVTLSYQRIQWKSSAASSATDQWDTP
jgi:type VI protein secretion system component Hcp